MNVIHITSRSNGYQIVELLANKYSHNNGFAVIKYLDGLNEGAIHITGGIIIEDNPQVREILDAIPLSKQYELCKLLRSEPFVKTYYTEEE